MGGEGRYVGCSQGRVRINLTYHAAICTVELLHFPHGLRLHPHPHRLVAYT